MNKKGFTLIELMIVIVILGILVGTILPRITGGQDRARDVAAKTDLTSLAQALELFYADYGYYPEVGVGAPDGNLESECIAQANAGANGTVSFALSIYLKSYKLPVASRPTLGCSGYFYQELSRNGSNNQAYIIGADMQNWAQANFTAQSGGLLLTAGNQTYAAASAIYGPLSAEAATAAQSVYVILP
ncbi:prepilin-type N-terminal cleavage/methylation domain-containing protein [Candidatus Peregrinibacteria bacterium]|nr:MAG: prepilin-type N-terminal cleavage/methylation domain-containing protein [Candidatus Peregrinibacteria bacterium]